MLLQAFDFTKFYWEATQLVPEGKYHTYLLQIISLRVSVEDVLIGTLIAFVIRVVDAGFVDIGAARFFVFMGFQFVLLRTVI